jgi:hypothetical protein
VVLTGCDPAPVPDDSDLVEVEVDVGDSGGAVVYVYPGGRLSDAEVERIRDSIDSKVFAEGTMRRTINSNDGGYSFIELISEGVYEPGPEPRVELDTRPLCEDLARTGFSKLRLWFDAPVADSDWSLVPSAPDEDGLDVTDCVDAPRGTLAMRPSPRDLWLSVAMVAVVVVANLSMFALGRTRDPRYRSSIVVLACLAGVTSAWLIWTGVAANPSEAAVAGQIGGLASTAASIVLAAVALIGLPAAIAQPVYWQQRRTRDANVDSARSGSTSSPAGWYPAPGDAMNWRYWDGDTWTSHMAPREIPADPRHGPGDDV